MRNNLYSHLYDRNSHLLFDAARQYSSSKSSRRVGGGSCLAAVSIMLYAGIRPHEVERLHWRDIMLDHRIILISPQNSKTGGARHVTIHPPLARILAPLQREEDAPICPPNWRKRWAALHKSAGFPSWRQDVLRHTFATHHLATFRSYAELQLEMGHRSASLLRTRYVAMDFTTIYSLHTPLLIDTP